MSFSFSCPNCKHKYTVPRDIRGRKVNCAHCNTKFRLAKPADEPESPPVADEDDSFDDLISDPMPSAPVPEPPATRPPPLSPPQPAEIPMASFDDDPVAEFEEMLPPDVLEEIPPPPPGVGLPADPNEPIDLELPSEANMDYAPAENFHTMPPASPRPRVKTRKKRTNPIVSAPAIALMVVSIISITMVSLGIAVDIVLLITGLAGEVRRPGTGVSPETQIFIRMIWGMAILASSSVILFSAIQMRRMENYSLAMLGSILAVIPCLGPCCILGIPFGIWSIIALMQPGVKETFRG